MYWAGDYLLQGFFHPECLRVLPSHMVILPGNLIGLQHFIFN